MNFKNMFKQINVVHERSGKNRIFIFFDMIICGFKYEAGYMDYMLFEMYNLNGKQRKTIMTRGKNNRLIKKYNDFTFKDYFLMKDKFDNKFKQTDKDVENINITTDKITKRFESINNVEIKNQDYLE